MHLIDLVAYSGAIYTAALVIVLSASWIIKPATKLWDKILWPGIILAGALILFGWVIKAIGWDPLLW